MGRPILRLLKLSVQGVIVVRSKVRAVKDEGRWVDLEYIVQVELTGLANGLKGRL